MPDPNYVTHINYAFGHVNATFDGVVFARPNSEGVVNETSARNSEERLRSIVALKQQNPNLKVLISIGGWGSGNFSEMAADPVKRLAFAADCQRLILEFGLDGIDSDWEYPTSSAARISATPEDKNNFTLMMRDIRNAIGPNKLLTFASAANAQYVDFAAVEPYVNFINIMNYDNAQGNGHHAAMHRSEFVRSNPNDESVERHVEQGVPIEKLVLGIPFYGRGRDSIQGYTHFENIIVRDNIRGVGLIQGRNIIHLIGHRDMWDDVAKVPYWVDSEGKFVFTYENVRSIEYKTAWLKQRGMLGAMYWEYSLDDAEGSLRKAVWYGVMSE